MTASRMRAPLNGEDWPRMRRPAFTLVELLIVVAVIIILLALLLPGIGMARASARQKKCSSNQVQIYSSWAKANSRDPRQPVRGPQWMTRVGAYMEGAREVLFCPDDANPSQGSSFGFNNRAWKFGAQDSGRIVLLDYKQTEANIVGRTVNQIDDEWGAYQAPRHFQQVNVAFFDGHTGSYAPEKINPRYCDYYIRYWRPVAESHIDLIGCTNSAEAPSTTSSSPGTTSSGTPTAGSSSTTTTTGSTTGTSSSSTSSTSTSTTTGGTPYDPCTPPPEASPGSNTDRGLQWLVRHQWDDGHWSFGHSQHPNCNGQCPNDGMALSASATALALLPLMGAGNSTQSGPYKDNVCRGLQFLISQQNPETGLIGPGNSLQSMYEHLMSNLALTEAVLQNMQMSSSANCGSSSCSLDPNDLRQAAQRALDYTVAAQSPYVENGLLEKKGGWQYGFQHNTGDMSHHSWAVTSLKNGTLAGLNVDPEAIDRARKFLPVQMWEPTYTQYGETLGDYSYNRQEHLCGQSALTDVYGCPRAPSTAQGLLCAVLTGSPTSHQKIQIFTSNRTYYRGAVYANFPMTRLMYLVGKHQWRAWSTAIKQDLALTQAVGNHVDGSWFFNGSLQDQEDTSWNATGGRHMCTTLSLLCLEHSFTRLTLGGKGGAGHGGQQPLEAWAGDNSSIMNPTTSVTLEGRTWGGAAPVTTEWSKVSGPGTVTFSDPTRINSSASFSAPGTYGLRLTATDGTTTVTSDVSVSYYQNPVSGRYVRIQIPATKYLILAEVQVFGSSGANIAVGRPATQSSTAFGAAASRAVDGNTDQSWAGGSVSMTSQQSNPWWQVDLGSNQQIKSITVWNRSDSLGDQLSGATVRVLDSSSNVLWTGTIPTAANCGVYPLIVGQ